MKKNMRILLSNDDGVHAEGLRAMYVELRKLGRVWVVAPLEERSTTGHSLTIHKPLRIVEMAGPGGARFHGVSGSPADCVNLGVRELMDGPPDLVVSGINRGANLGQDVYYSGTVSAAREACIMGIPSLAVSLAVDFNSPRSEKKLHYATAAKLALRVVRAKPKFPKHTLLNLNVPDLPLAKIRGIRPARQGFRHYSGAIVGRVDHRGKPYYWIGGKYQGFHRAAGTDCQIVDDGYASLTPLKIDTTDLVALASMECGLSGLWAQGTHGR